VILLYCIGQTAISLDLDNVGRLIPDSDDEGVDSDDGESEPSDLPLGTRLGTVTEVQQQRGEAMLDWEFQHVAWTVLQSITSINEYTTVGVE